MAAVAVQEQRPVHGSKVEEHDHQDEEVVKEPKQPQHACTSNNTPISVHHMSPRSLDCKSAWIGGATLTLGKDVDRAQHVHSAQDHLHSSNQQARQVRIYMCARSVSCLASIAPVTNGWYEDE